MLRVRQATTDDVPRLVAMGAAFLESSRYGRLFPPGPGRLEHFVRRVLEVGVIFVLERKVEVDDPVQIVGLLAVVPVDEHPLTGEPYVDEVAWWVDPAHRGRAGVVLLHHLEGWARQVGLDMVKMVAPEGMTGTAVRTLLEHRGYVPVETAFMRRGLHGAADSRDRRRTTGRGPADGAQDGTEADRAPDDDRQPPIPGPERR